MNPVFIFLIILGAAVGIGLVAFLIYLYLKPKLKKDDKPTDEQIVAEEINRVLKPIDDEETAKAVEDYKWIHGLSSLSFHRCVDKFLAELTFFIIAVFDEFIHSSSCGFIDTFCGFLVLIDCVIHA